MSILKVKNSSGTWEEVTSIKGDSYNNATTTTDGLMSSSDKTKLDDIGKTVYKVGSTNNSTTTFTLNVDINDYRYVLLIGGYGYSKASSIMPISLFKTFGSSFNVLATYVQIYGGTAFASLSHISDTEIKINGTIGTDCYVDCYLVK